MAITATKKDMSWPHSYAVILRNKTTNPVNIPWLGRHGIIFGPEEVVAIVGNPLVVSERINQYNGKKTIRDLSLLISDEILEVLSIPGGDKEEDDSSIPLEEINKIMF
jgi:hypothetical protein